MTKRPKIHFSWSMPGCPPEDGLITAKELKPIGARIHIHCGGYYFMVDHHDNWGDERFPWRLMHRVVVGQNAPSENWDVLEEFPSLASALKEAKRIIREGVFI